MAAIATALVHQIKSCTNIEERTPYFEENIRILQTRGVEVASLWGLLQKKRAENLYTEITALSRSWQSAALLPVQAKKIQTKLQDFALRVKQLPMDKSDGSYVRLTQLFISEGNKKITTFHQKTALGFIQAFCADPKKQPDLSKIVQIDPEDAVLYLDPVRVMIQSVPIVHLIIVGTLERYFEKGYFEAVLNQLLSVDPSVGFRLEINKGVPRGVHIKIGSGDTLESFALTAISTEDAFTIYHCNTGQSEEMPTAFTSVDAASTFLGERYAVTSPYGNRIEKQFFTSMHPLRENVLQLDQIREDLEHTPLIEIAAKLRGLTERFTSPITGYEDTTLCKLVYFHLALIQTKDPKVEAADEAEMYKVFEAFQGIGKWPATPEQRAEAIGRALLEACLAGAYKNLLCFKERLEHLDLPPSDRAELKHILRGKWGILEE